MMACALFACAFFTSAYDIKTTVSIEGESIWYFDIELENNDIDFTAFQLDITLDSENAELKTADLHGDKLMADHALVLAKPDGHYRVVGYSQTNSLLQERNGCLFYFSVDGDIKGITINKIIFAKPDGTEVEADVYTLPLNRDEDAVEEMAASQEMNKVIYNMEGKQVYRIDRRGIYIQNGRKIAK